MCFSNDKHIYIGFANAKNANVLQIVFKDFTFDIFLQFVRQRGVNYLSTLSGLPPGNDFRNQPVIVLNRWQHPGDISKIQKFTTVSGSTEITNLALSDAVYSDASFIRCKNVSLSYSLPTKLIAKLKLSDARIYCNAQNLFTITGYMGADPENQNIYRMPPLRVIVAGIQLNL